MPPRGDARPFRRRQGHGTRLESVIRVAVKIRSAGDEHAETARQALVFDNVLGPVIGVVDLERIEAVIDERANQLVAFGHRGMRERRHIP